VCVVMNSADDKDAEIGLPGGEWLVALDEKGAADPLRVITGKVSVRHKSGAILFQE
jgi:hypothetical protein